MKLFSILFVCITITLQANIAMPGYFNTGSGRNFTPFLKEDSVYFEKIQMHKEFITILLYKGYAVIKGEYYMVNNSQKDITLRVGFPVNGSFDVNGLQNVMYDQLYGLSVNSAGKSVPVYSLDEYLKKNGLPATDTVVNTNIYPELDNSDNWYVWESDFPSGDTTKIDVYYIVHTNDAKLREGYSVSKENGLGYIVETGSTWGGVIDTAHFRVFLMDGLTNSDVIGVAPGFITYNKKENSLDYSFYGMKPDKDNNIIVRYSEPIKEFNFESVLEQTRELFSRVDKYSVKTRFIETGEGIHEKVESTLKPENELTNYLWWGVAVVGGLTVLYFVLRMR